MNPMLLQLLQRFGPRAAGMLSNGFGQRAGMIQSPEPEVSALPPQPQGPPSVAPPISQSNYSPPAPPVSIAQATGDDYRPSGVNPNERVAQGFNMFGPSPLQTATATPSPLPGQGFNAPAPAQPPSVPVPMARPPEAPEPMGFFERNAAMMRDPNDPSTSFIDPVRAAQAQASGPDLIAKYMQFFKNKETA